MNDYIKCKLRLPTSWKTQYLKSKAIEKINKICFNQNDYICIGIIHIGKPMINLNCIIDFSSRCFLLILSSL